MPSARRCRRPRATWWTRSIVTEKYGTDAVRMALVLGAASGMDIVFTRRAHGKLARLRQQNLERRPLPVHEDGSRRRRALDHPEHDCCVPEPDPATLEPTIEDRWIFSPLQRGDRNRQPRHRAVPLPRGSRTIWQFLWHEFCDWYIELKKLKLDADPSRATSAPNHHWKNILTVFERSMRLLHPIMPFLTEELWQRLAANQPQRPQSIALARYPQFNEEAADLRAEVEMAILQEIITSARALRADHKIDKKLQLPATIWSDQPSRLRDRPARARRHRTNRESQSRAQERARAETAGRRALHTRVRPRPPPARNATPRRSKLAWSRKFSSSKS